MKVYKVENRDVENPYVDIVSANTEEEAKSVSMYRHATDGIDTYDFVVTEIRNTPFGLRNAMVIDTTYLD